MIVYIIYDFLNYIYFDFILNFVFIFDICIFAVTLMLRARSCQSWGEPSLTGPKRIWER